MFYEDATPSSALNTLMTMQFKHTNTWGMSFGNFVKKFLRWGCCQCMVIRKQWWLEKRECRNRRRNDCCINKKQFLLYINARLEKCVNICSNESLPEGIEKKWIGIKNRFWCSRLDLPFFLCCWFNCIIIIYIYTVGLCYTETVVFVVFETLLNVH